MPQVRSMQQSLFPELSGTFREPESFATLNQEAQHDSPRRIEHHIPGNPDSILELMQLPAFQNLLAKVETNFYRNRPKEAAELELEGTIRFTLQERAAQAWEILAKARSTGLPMDQAQELISELVYPPLESDDN